MYYKHTQWHTHKDKQNDTHIHNDTHTQWHTKMNDKHTLTHVQLHVHLTTKAYKCQLSKNNTNLY